MDNIDTGAGGAEHVANNKSTHLYVQSFWQILANYINLINVDIILIYPLEGCLPAVSANDYDNDSTRNFQAAVFETRCL